MPGTVVQHWGIEANAQRGRHAILVSERLAVRAYIRRQALWFITHKLVPVETLVRAREMLWYFEFFGEEPEPGVEYPKQEVTEDPEVIAEWATEGELADRFAGAVLGQVG